MTTSEFDSQCDDIISSIKNKDGYIGEAVIAVNRTIDTYVKGTKDCVANIDNISESLADTFSDFDKYYEAHKPVVDDLHLTEDSFLFANGGAATVRNNQIEALKFANNIAEANACAESKKSDVENIKKQKPSNGDFYKSRLMLRKKCDPVELKKALCEVMYDDEADKCVKELNSPSLTADMRSYQAAQNTVDALNKHHIESTVVNIMSEDIPKEVYEKNKERIKEKCEKKM